MPAKRKVPSAAVQIGLTAVMVVCLIGLFALVFGG